jgi:hypothetical protein
MAVTPVTPTPALTTVVTVGGASVQVVPAGPQGGFITNPASDADQNVTAEDLFVNPIGPADVNGFGTTFRIAPGQSWSFIPGQTTPTYVNANTSGHRFSAVYTV